MKTVAIAVLLMLMHAHLWAGDWTASGGMAERLALAVSYEPGGARFVVVLKNRSAETLSLQVEGRRFHGRFVVRAGGGEAVEYWDFAFRQLLLTGVWEVPVQSLRSRAEIRWEVPVSELRDLRGGKLAVERLRGASVHAVLEEAAVVPARGWHIGDNARQTSRPITIPADAR